MTRLLQKGLSLVELMIALGIGSVVTVGVVQLFTANSETYSVMMGQSRMQESARFALDFISRDIQKAGYKGCFSNNEALYWTIPDPDDLPYEFDLRFGVRGYDAAGVDIWAPSLAELPSTVGATNTNVFVNGTGIDTDSIVTGTDVLTLRNIVMDDVEIRLAADMTPTSQADIFVISPPDGVDGLGFNELDLALIHDCAKATIFHVTDVAPQADGTIMLQHLILPGVDWRNDFLTLALKDNFEADAMVSGIETHTYFIAPGAGQNDAGDTPLSLWRKSGTSVPVELVEGIENLQVLFGVSTDGDTTPNRYMLANEVLDWKEVTTIRVTVVANTVDDVGGVSTPSHGCVVQTCYPDEPVDGIDGLMRRAFTQTIMLRNRS